MVKSTKNKRVKIKNDSLHTTSLTNESDGKIFFTRKKIIIFSLFFLLTIALFTCTIIFVFKTNIFSLMMQIKFGLLTKSKRFWFLLLIIYFLIVPIFNVISL